MKKTGGTNDPDQHSRPRHMRSGIQQALAYAHEEQACRSNAGRNEGEAQRHPSA